MSAARQQHHMRMQAALLAGAVAKPRLGLVTEYDKTTFSVKARIQPEDIETGWLPISTAMIGAGWGIYAAPLNGDQAVILFQEGDRELGVVIGFLPNEADAPPPVPAGEIWTVHKDGGLLKFHAAGVVEMAAPGGLNITANTTITGTLHVTQDVTVDTKLTAANDVIGGGKHLVSHVHSGVTTGGGNTGAPV